jgi:hypothetical protein
MAKTYRTGSCRRRRAQATKLISSDAIKRIYARQVDEDTPAMAQRGTDQRREGLHRRSDHEDDARASR